MWRFKKIKISFREILRTLESDDRRVLVKFDSPTNSIQYNNSVPDSG
jgi:hypothetical protein